MICVVCREPAAWMCAECIADASTSALHAASKRGPVTGPTSHVAACHDYAHAREAEAAVHLVRPSGDVRARWRRLMAAEGAAGAYALAELLCLLREHEREEG